MPPRFIPTVEQFRNDFGPYDGFLLEHREPSRLRRLVCLRPARPLRGRLRPPAEFR